MNAIMTPSDTSMMTTAANTVSVNGASSPQVDAEQNMSNLTLPTQYGSNQDPATNAAHQLSALANNIANAIGDQSSSNTGTSTGAYSGGAVAQGEPGPTSGSTGGKGTVGTTSTNLADYIGR